ncbi:MAG: DsbC family protein [Rubrivivax sp.]|nr:DsbC family protein [Rubrivivax sp.]
MNRTHRTVSALGRELGCAALEHARARIQTFALLALLALWLSILVYAGRANATEAFAPRDQRDQRAPTSLTAFTDRLRAQHPGTRIDSVAASPVAGLYEVVMGRNVAYVDESGRYFLFGHVWDMAQRRDLTADLKATLDRVDPTGLPLELALRHVSGKGTRMLYVFADPTCGFCKQLEAALVGVPDLSVHTFVVPVLGPQAKRIATAIGCAPDPAAAWSAWMLRAQEPALDSASASCEAGAARVAAAERLASSLGITGTPTLIAADGRKSAGFMSASQLNTWLGMTGVSPAPVAGAARATPAAAPVAPAAPVAKGPVATAGAPPPTLKTTASTAAAKPQR